MNKGFGNTCVCIARVSTTQQDYDAQINALHKRASEFGLTVIKDIATKESGFMSFDKKEGFKELVDFMSANNCRIVLCTELSRLSRKKFLLEQIKQWFIENKIQLWVDDISFSLFDENQDIQMTTDIVFSVFAAIAEREMKDKFKRMKRGRAELMKEGYSIGGKTTFGYTRKNAAVKIKGKARSIFEINETEAEQIRTIYDWYLNGIDGDWTRCSISKIKDECIARGFGKYLHSKRNVNKALKYEPYTGEEITTRNRQKNTEYWVYDNKTAPKYIVSTGKIKLPQIISRQIFDDVQAKLISSDVKKIPDSKTPGGFSDKSRVHSTLLTKTIVCPKCGKCYSGEYRIKKGERGLHSTYRCINHKAHGASSISMRYLDFAAWEFSILHHHKYMEFIKQNPGTVNTEVFEKRIENITNKKNELNNELTTLAKRFLLAKDVSPSSLEIFQIFEKESSRLKKEIANCEKLIADEQIKKKIAIQNAKLAIENKSSLNNLLADKNEMKKFIQRVIKSIVPVFQDMEYIVLDITLRDGTYKFFTVDPEEPHGNLPYHNYIIIYKLDNLRPKFRQISAYCEFDSSRKTFSLPNSAFGTLENVFGDEEEVYFKSMSKYQPLEIYDDEAPAGKTIEKLIRPIPAPPPSRKKKDIV